MPLKHSLLAVAVAVVWGANFVVIDEGLHGVPALTFVALRFTVVVVPAIFLLAKPDIPWRVIAVIGLFLSVGQFGLLYSGIAAGLPPGLASLVVQAQVMFTVIFAAGALHERPTRRQVAGVVIGAVGLLVVAAGRSSHTPLLGVMLGLAAAVSWASGNVALRYARVQSGVAITVWSALFVPIPLLALSFVIDGPHAIGDGLAHFSLANILSTLYSAWLASLFGYGIWNSLLARHQASAVVPFTLLVPPVGLATAWIAEGERPGTAEVVGGLLLLIGVAVTAITRGRGRSATIAAAAEMRNTAPA